MSATKLTEGQEIFVKSITDKVSSLMGSQLPGKFQMVNYPPGFRPAVQFGSPPVYNSTMLDAFNATLEVGTNALLTLGNAQFSTVYFNILAGASYQYSTADNKVVNDPNIQNQQIAVVNTATSGGFATQFKVATPVTYYLVIKAVLENFSDNKTDWSSSNISAAAKGLGNAGFASLQAAVASSTQQLAPLNAILNAQSVAEGELTAAQNNTQNPSSSTGGLDIGDSKYYVGWTPMPTNNQIQGGLQGAGSVSINVQASNFEASDAHLSIDGSGGFTIPILDCLDIGLSAKSSYDWSKHTSSSSSLNMTLDYEGVSLVQIDPMTLSADHQTGWYDETLLQSIIKGSGNPDISGFKIPTSSQYNIADTFGAGKLFSRMRTFVVSQAPTIKMVFSADQAEAVTSQFKEDSSVTAKLFGVFTVGAFNESYSITKVHKDSASGSVTVTMAPPKITGTVPIQQQVCNILGGVADYPPAH